MNLNARTEIVKSGTDAISQSGHMVLSNASGTQSNILWKFGSTLRTGIVGGNSGSMSYHGGGSQPTHTFYQGSSLSVQFPIVQLSSVGIYNYGNSFNTAKGTFGSPDVGATSTLQVHGSSAFKGITVTSNTYTLADETFVYLDPASALACTGTPSTACSSYMTQTPCNSHSAAGCSWFAGTQCSDQNYTDSGTCTGYNAACVWEETDCSPADNTDQSTCEGQNSSWGGSCSWYENGCNNYTDEPSCSAVSACTWSSSSCSDFDGDQSSCEANSGCTWDGDNSLCTGNYNESCNGSTCSGNYNTGLCNGSFGAACQGTASCSNLTDNGETACNNEAGCTWTVGQTVTLPTTANASRQGTASRAYFLQHIGAEGISVVQPNSGQEFFKYGGSDITFYKAGDSAVFHFYPIANACSAFTLQGDCTPSGCTWTNGCAIYNSDQESCEAASGCSYSDPDCTGNYSCTGTWYKNYWFVHNHDFGEKYSQQTDKSLSNTASETTLIDTTDAIGSVIFPADFFNIGDVVRFQADGYHSSTGNPTVTVRAKLGGVTIATLSGSSNNGTDEAIRIEGIFTIRSIGASGTLMAQMFYQELQSNGLQVGSSNTTTSSIDTTASNTFDLTFEFSSADVNNAVTCTNLIVTLKDR